MEAGFEDELREILKLLPKEGRQTMLFSATQTSKIEDLARLSLKKPVVIGLDQSKSEQQHSSTVRRCVRVRVCVCVCVYTRTHAA